MHAVSSVQYREPSETRATRPGAHLPTPRAGQADVAERPLIHTPPFLPIGARPAGLDLADAGPRIEGGGGNCVQLRVGLLNLTW
jgi:hypothetical protein